MPKADPDPTKVRNPNINRTYRSWASMIYRCKGKSEVHKRRYTDRGITVCERWMEWENFREDMGTIPDDMKCLDRIDNDKGYFPGNCRWTTALVNNGNKSNNVNITFNGETKILSQWSRELGIVKSALKIRVEKYGVDYAFNVPKREIKKLTYEVVLEIKKLIHNKVPSVEIAKKYGVSHSTISAIKNGKAWNRVALEVDNGSDLSKTELSDIGGK